MKVEPIEYLVTFEDGELPKKYGRDVRIIKDSKGKYRIDSLSGMYLMKSLQWELWAGRYKDWQYDSLEEALETLKKWKEKQDEAI